MRFPVLAVDEHELPPPAPLSSPPSPPGPALARNVVAWRPLIILCLFLFMFLLLSFGLVCACAGAAGRQTYRACIGSVLVLPLAQLFLLPAQ